MRYEERNLEPSTWTSLEAFAKSLEPLVSRSTFISVLKRVGSQIETGEAVLDGNTVSLIRPKYFLERIA
jgi:hypothetical protein